MSEQQPDPIEALYSQKYTEMDRALTGSGAEANREWSAVVNARYQLERLGVDVADGIAEIQDNPLLSEMERYQRIKDNRDIFDATRQRAEKDLERSLDAFQESLVAAQRSDLVVAEPGERPLIRDEIQRYLAEATKPRQDAWGGARHIPGEDTKIALLKLMEANPGRYAAEVAGDYGKMLVSPAEHRELVKLAMLVTPGQTPKSQSARVALAALDRTKLRGLTAGISHVAKQRVEKASTPKPPERGQYIPDTIRPIR